MNRWPNAVVLVLGAAFLSGAIFCRAQNLPEDCILLKISAVQQVSDSLQSPDGSYFLAEVDFVSEPAAGTVVQVVCPQGQTLNLIDQGGGTFEAIQDFYSDSARDAAFPSGTYTAKVSIPGGGSSSTGINAGFGPAVPPPLITNFDALQSWTGEPVVFTWQTIPGLSILYGTLDLEVDDSGANVLEQSSLQANATSGWLSPLPANQALTGMLDGAEATQVSTNNGVPAATAMGFQVSFPLERLSSPPVFTQQLSGPTEPVYIGAGLFLNATATSPADGATYVWLKDGVAAPRQGWIDTGGGGHYWVTSVLPSDAGTYTVEAVNSDGTVISTSSVTVTVLDTMAVTSLAGSYEEAAFADGTGSAARFNQPSGIAVDAQGNVYVADSGNDVIRKITPSGVVTTLAGSPGQKGSADGRGSSALFNFPTGLAIDSGGVLYVADTNNNEIRRIGTDGTVTTVAGSPARSGNVDGPASVAAFTAPHGVAVGAGGLLYVADTGDETIRTISSAGVVATLAGTAGKSNYVDGTGTSAQFYQPYQLFLASNGVLYVSDDGKIRMVSGATVTTYVVKSVPEYYDYGQGSGGIVVDGSGNVFIASSQAITEYTTGGVMFDVASPAIANLANSGGSPSYFLGLKAMTLGPGGTFFVADAEADEIQEAQLHLGSPDIAASPELVAQTIATNSTVVLQAAVTGTNLSYQWSFNGSPIAGATNSLYMISPAGSSAAGAYSVAMSNSYYNLATPPAQLSVTNTSNPGRLVNLSVNAVAGSGSQLLTVGFYTGGAGTSGSEALLVQALGPKLSSLGVTGVMPDPQLTIFNAAQSQIGFNAGWGSPASNQAAVVAADTATYATALTDPTSKDSATVTTLAPGGYTIQVGSASGVMGRTLAAFYDDTPAGAYTLTTPRLINLSCRLQVTANSSLTAGFYVEGATSKTVLIRADGPALLAQGVTGVMPDPQLTVYDASQNVIDFNAGWGGSPILASIAAAVYAQPFKDPASKDSEVVLTLPPGGYTAQVASVSNTPGDVMIEVFEVP